MTSIADGAVSIQASAESVPATPSWFGEVTLIVRYLRKHGVLSKISEGVRFAQRRFGRYSDGLPVRFYMTFAHRSTISSSTSSLRLAWALSVRQLHHSQECRVSADHTGGMPLPPRVLQQPDAAWGEVPHLAITHHSFKLTSQEEEKLSSWHWVRRTVPFSRNGEETNSRTGHQGGHIHRRRWWGKIGQGHRDFYVFEVGVAALIGIDTNIFHASPRIKKQSFSKRHFFNSTRYGLHLVAHPVGTATPTTSSTGAPACGCQGRRLLAPGNGPCYA